jgi:hypothetical protein
MTRAKLIKFCRDRGACDEGLEWIESTPGTVRHLWDTCPNPDFMWWLASWCHQFDESACRRAAFCGTRSKRLADTVRRTVSWGQIKATIED